MDASARRHLRDPHAVAARQLTVDATRTRPPAVTSGIAAASAAKLSESSSERSRSALRQPPRIGGSPRPPRPGPADPRGPSPRARRPRPGGRASPVRAAARPRCARRARRSAPGSSALPPCARGPQAVAAVPGDHAVPERVDGDRRRDRPARPEHSRAPEIASGAPLADSHPVPPCGCRPRARRRRRSRRKPGCRRCGRSGESRRSRPQSCRAPIRAGSAHGGRGRSP